ncbi:hypothetical protein AX17_000480 [Amanita inopinata Kibby_2008]|nr:hypothetical protein AX17_000480 [Amanita inopinata Kibby_2008]
MWISSSSKSPGEFDRDEGQDNEEIRQDMKIAWRYANMKQFQTTVASASRDDEFCQTFDLTGKVPGPVLNQALQSGQLTCISVSDAEAGLRTVLRRIAMRLESSADGLPIRVCIPSLASPQWGDITGQDVLHFLQSLRSLLRRYPHACASLSLASHVSTEQWGGSGWVHKLGWLSDAAITVAAFSSNPSLSATFPSHHGLLRIHSLPAPHTLQPPSDRFSTLRGLSTSAGSAGGSGENNLAFKCTRRRMIFETLHLDMEGGVSERRTRPPPMTYQEHEVIEVVDKEGSGVAAVTVAIEDVESGKLEAVGQAPKVKKEKKKVGFRSDRPELYEF